MRFLFFLLSLLFGSCWAMEPQLQGRFGYMLFSDKQVRSVFSHGAYDVELQPAMRWCNFSLWANAAYAYSLGRMPSHARTQLYLGSLSAGSDYFLSLGGSDGEVYLGAGLLAGYLYMINKDPSLTRKSCSWCPGFVLKTGFLVHSTDGFYADIFFDYTYQPQKLSNNNGIGSNRQNFGGLRLGVGLGF